MRPFRSPGSQGEHHAHTLLAQVSLAIVLKREGYAPGADRRLHAPALTCGSASVPNTPTPGARKPPGPRPADQA